MTISQSTRARRGASAVPTDAGPTKGSTLGPKRPGGFKIPPPPANRTEQGGRACTTADRKTASRILNRLKVGLFLLPPLSTAQRESFQTIAAGRCAYLCPRYLEWLAYYDRATQPCRASNPAAVAEVLS